MYRHIRVHMPCVRAYVYACTYVFTCVHIIGSLSREGILQNATNFPDLNIFLLLFRGIEKRVMQVRRIEIKIEREKERKRRDRGDEKVSFSQIDRYKYIIIYVGKLNSRE